MKSFEQLTDRGQAKRLKFLVIRARDRYDLEVSNIQMGVLFARLHEHGAAFVPPDGFTKRKLDYFA